MMLKDHLQQKRFIAQNQNNTTYVYDFPEVFRQALHKQWQQLALPEKEVNMADLLSCTEMVLDSQKQLVLQTRLPGENDVCFNTYSKI